MSILYKKAQISVFIIVSILIIASVTAFLFLRKDILPKTGGGEETNPKVFLESCIEDDLKNAIDLMSQQGGYIENPLYKEFDSKKISYLCFNQNYYKPCVNQEPLLIQHLKEEIEQNISQSVQNCFDELTTSLERKSYTIDAIYRGFDIELKSKKIFLNINAKLTLTKSGETSSIEDFKIIIPSRIYDLAILVQEIVSQEAEYCNFEHLGYMLLHSNMDIFRRKLGEGTTIYGITDKKTKEDFWFAVRSCAIAPGV